MSILERVAELDKLFVKQHITLIVNRYDVSTLDADGKSAGDLLAYVEQKRMKLREEINFFAADDKSQPVLQLKKRNIMEFHGVTDVKLADGTVIGGLRKQFGRSLFRSTWEVLDPQENVIATAQERSMFVAIVRRTIGLVPYGDYIVPFIPFHFDIYIGETNVGAYTRPSGLGDRYVLDLTGDPERRIDRRVAMAFCIALDALQDR